MQISKGKIKLKLSSSFATMLNVKPSSLINLEYDMEDGATIGSMLTELVSRHPSLHDYLFNPENNEVNERIDIVLNNALLNGNNIAKVTLHDGDTIFLLPVYEGG